MKQHTAFTVRTYLRLPVTRFALYRLAGHCGYAFTIWFTAIGYHVTVRYHVGYRCLPFTYTVAVTVYCHRSTFCIFAVAVIYPFVRYPFCNATARYVLVPSTRTRLQTVYAVYVTRRLPFWLHAFGSRFAAHRGC